MRRSGTLVLVLALSACGGNNSGPADADAAMTIVPSGEVDARPGTADAHVTAPPDAHATTTPDAHATTTPDAHVTTTPDARPGTPDAHVAPPDASVPTCVGTWTAIPPLMIDGNAITPEHVASLGNTLYYLYKRPNANGNFYDVARYTTSGGWRTSLSTNAIDLKFSDVFVAKSDHVIVYYISTDSVHIAMRRGVLSFTALTWAVSDPLQPASSFTSDVHRGFPAVTDDFITFYGAEVIEANPSTGFSSCESRGETFAFPVDDPSTATAATPPTDAPIGSRSNPVVGGTSAAAFFFGGYRWPEPPGSCTFAVSTALHDGAFYSPATGAWGPTLSIDPVATLNPSPPPPLALGTADRMILLEDLDEGAHGTGRAHVAAADSAGFTSIDLPAELEILWRTTSDVATATPAGPGFVALRAEFGFVVDLATAKATPLCAPPTAFPALATSSYGGQTSDGAVIVRGGIAAYLHL